MELGSLDEASELLHHVWKCTAYKQQNLGGPLGKLARVEEGGVLRLLLGRRNVERSWRA